MQKSVKKCKKLVFLYFFIVYKQNLRTRGGSFSQAARWREKQEIQHSRKSLTTFLGHNLSGFEPKLIKLEFIIYLPKLKVFSSPFFFNYFLTTNRRYLPASCSHFHYFPIDLQPNSAIYFQIDFNSLRFAHPFLLFFSFVIFSILLENSLHILC